MRPLSGLSVLTLVLLAGTAGAGTGQAAQTAPPAAAPAVQAQTGQVGGFKPLASTPTPGEIRAAEIERAQMARLEQECRERRSRGERVGIVLGTIAGIGAGLLIADPGEDDQQIIAGTAGAAVGATAGAVIGEMVDPRDPCRTDPRGDRARDEREPGRDPLAQPLPASTIGSGPEPVPGRRDRE